MRMLMLLTLGPESWPAVALLPWPLLPATSTTSTITGGASSTSQAP
jgi:hypothetical protein